MPDFDLPSLGEAPPQEHAVNVDVTDEANAAGDGADRTPRLGPRRAGSEDLDDPLYGERDDDPFDDEGRFEEELDKSARKTSKARFDDEEDRGRRTSRRGRRSRESNRRERRQRRRDHRQDTRDELDDTKEEDEYVATEEDEDRDDDRRRSRRRAPEDDRRQAREDEDEDGDDTQAREDLEDGLEDEDLERIEKHPAMRRYKQHLVRNLNRGMRENADERTELSTMRRELTKWSDDRDTFMEQLQTEESAIAFYERELRRHPDVIGGIFSKLTTGEVAEDTLVEIMLHDDKVFTKAWERGSELLKDPAKRQAHDARVRLQSRERALEKRETAHQQALFRRDLSGIEERGYRVAHKMGIHRDDFDEVQEALKRVATRAANANSGRARLTNKQILAVVTHVNKRLNRTYDKIKSRSDKRESERSQKKTRRRAKGSRRRRSSPRSRSGRTPRRRSRRVRVPPGTDPLDALLDDHLEREYGTN